jgi:transposase
MTLYYVGLDWHLHTSTIVMLDAHGKTVAQRTIRGHWSRAVDWLREQKLPMAICFEASCGYGVLHEQLATFAKRIVVAHPANLRLIFRSKRKNDRVDAGKLATLLLLDQVPAVHVPGVDVRAWREAIEFRRRQVDLQTRLRNQLRAMLRSNGVAIPREVRSLWTKAGRAWIESVELPALTSLRREILLSELDHAVAMVKRLTHELDRIARDHAGVKLLMTIPGVGARTAEAIVAYIDNPQRFARTSRIGAYLGLVPCQDSSAGVNRLGRITRQGPGTVRKLLVQAAWQGVRRCEALRATFDRITADKPDRRKIALIAVAHKLARIMLAMLRSGEAWHGDYHAAQIQSELSAA